MKNSVICIANSYLQADRIIRDLQASGFLSTEISVLASDTHGKRDFGHVKSSKAPEGAASGALLGGVTGGLVGLLAGIGTLAIPGLGALIAAGPILATLSGAAAGAATGGTVGGLIGLGLPEYEAKRYGEKLGSGNYLLAVHVENEKEEDLAEDIYTHHGADDVSSMREAEVPGAQ